MNTKKIMFKPMPDMTYTLKLYWYKENLFQTYTRYVLYFKAILDTSSIQIKFCFKCTLDVTCTSKLYWILLQYKENVVSSLHQILPILEIKYQKYLYLFWPLL